LGKKGGKYGFVDINGHITIPIIYDDVDFQVGRAGVWKDGKRGYIDLHAGGRKSNRKNGKTIV